MTIDHSDRSVPAVADLLLGQLHASLTDAGLNSMNVLNEIAGDYPAAVSFAAGRPAEAYFETTLVHDYLRRFEEHLRERGYSEPEVRRTFYQYGRTKGIITDLIADNLRRDEGISVSPESVVVTTGAQEAMLLVLRALRRDSRDVLLAVAPAYVGISGAATLVDLPVVPVEATVGGVDLGDLAARVAALRAEGRRPRACYLVPDFSNPSGDRLGLADRRALLEFAERADLLLLEDNPYGLFGDDDTRIPTLKALDTRRRVVYIGSYAKSGLPGARIGFVVADQLVGDERSHDPARPPGLFADELAKIKSMTTVNTSPIAQAVLGGKLLTHAGDLRAANHRQTAAYRRNRAHLRSGLETVFATTPGVTWNHPRGGFFQVLTVPFVADDELLLRSARDYGVLWTPMSYFTASPPARSQLRLSYSQLTPAQIDEGLDRLAALVADQLPGGS